MIDAALAVSIKAPILLTVALVPATAGRGGGEVINMGSVNAITGMAKTALYSSTKSAVHDTLLSRAYSTPAQIGPTAVFRPATTTPTSTAPSSPSTAASPPSGRPRANYPSMALLRLSHGCVVRVRGPAADCVRKPLGGRACQYVPSE